MSVDEVMARLYPKTMSLSPPGSGAPELTAQDIAAAIAFVPPGLGREVMIAVGWQAGATHTEIVRMATELACAEINRRAAQATRDAMHYAIECWERKRGPLIVDKQRSGWPRNAVDRLPAVITACLREIAHPNHCTSCDGRKAVKRGDLIIDCAACGKTGVTPVSDRKRAERIGINESAYRRNGWDQLYAWMLGQMTDAYNDARRAYREALR